MVNTPRIADLIRDPTKTDGIPEAIEDGSFHHMQSFAQHLVQLVLDEVIEIETAAAAAPSRHDFEIAVQQALRKKRVAEETGKPVVDPHEVHVDEPEEEELGGLRVA
jgi:Tfp pilus assembly ATPase PilU